MTPLCRRMIEDMGGCNFSALAITLYINAVTKYSQYFGKSPELLNPEKLRLPSLPYTPEESFVDRIKHRRQHPQIYLPRFLGQRLGI
jgi:hypothetical protein